MVPLALNRATFDLSVEWRASRGDFDFLRLVPAYQWSVELEMTSPLPIFSARNIAARLRARFSLLSN
jgi:hypothetical protein